jgi:hypothetical protein
MGFSFLIFSYKIKINILAVSLANKKKKRHKYMIILEENKKIHVNFIESPKRC